MLAIRQKLADAKPAVRQLQTDLADGLLQVQSLLVETGRPGESIAFFEREAAIWKALADTNPTVRDFRHNLAKCQTNTAIVLVRLGRSADARGRFEQATALGETLVSDDPNAAAYRKGLAESLLRSGQACKADGDVVAASAQWRRAVAVLENESALNGEARLHRRVLPRLALVNCRAARHGIVRRRRRRQSRPGGGPITSGGRIGRSQPREIPHRARPRRPARPRRFPAAHHGPEHAARTLRPRPLKDQGSISSRHITKRSFEGGMVTSNLAAGTR